MSSQPATRRGSSPGQPGPTPPGATIAAAGLAALVACTVTPGAHAQTPAASDGWSAPYCGPQPMVSAIFDHRHPRYARDGSLLLYSGDDIAACADAEDARPGYDGHSGWDYTREAFRQGCGVGRRLGAAGDLVFAVADGRVAEARWDRAEHDGRGAGYGLMVALEHDGGEASFYGHLAALFVREGESVQRGQVVGALGTTGNSSGPHLHFQAAREAPATDSAFAFDPYGWSRSFGPGQVDPAFEDPHRGSGWSRRRLDPGQAGPSCPLGCAAWVVDQEDPSVRWGCGGGGADCGPWERLGGGWAGEHRWTESRGGPGGRWVRYVCAACPPGPYLVEAYVPGGAASASAHVARYRLGALENALDQHAEGDRWQPIGVARFSGRPWVQLSDQGDWADYRPPAGKRLAADAIRFRLLCEGIPPDLPSVPEPDPSAGGAR